MANQENMFRHPRQKRVLGKMLAKVLVPFIYKTRVWSLDETLRPIDLKEFVGLNEQLPFKFPKIFASRRWQAIVNYYAEVMQELESQRD